MSLSDARMRALEIQRDAKQGKQAEGVRKSRRTALATAQATAQFQQRQKQEQENALLRAVALHWLSEREPSWSIETYRKAYLVVHSYHIPEIGELDMRTITTADVKPVLLKMNLSTPNLARKARQYINAIVGHAIDEGLRADEQTLRLNRILPTQQKGHLPAVTDDEERLGDVMRAIYRYENRVVRGALMLTALTAMRPGALVCAQWSEFNLSKAEWKIPGKNPDGTNRMKTGRDFMIPLPTQALAVLHEMKQRTGGETYVFAPQARQRTPHLSRDALSKALREMGFQGEHCTHGFRASLRTFCREVLEIPVDVLEAQLAHAPKDEIQAAYARVKFNKQRGAALQRWADYLDKLRNQNAVVPISRRAS
jgi:integrase